MDDRLRDTIIQQPVNIFNGVLDNDCSHIVKMGTVLNGIVSGEWQDDIEKYRAEKNEDKRKELKKKFTGITFSGTFKERRLDKNLNHYNNVLVIDIDDKDMKMTYDKTFKCVTDTPFVFCAFKSPSGGIKALAYSDMDDEYHKIFFNGVEEYFLDEFGIVMDASGKNPGRLCFISYDPNMYLSFDDKRLFDIEKDGPKTYLTEESRRFVQTGDVDYGKYEDSYDVRYILDMAKGWAANGVGAYHKGNRNNYIFCLSCIFNRAGVTKDPAIGIIFQTYPSLGFEEVKRTVESAYRHNPNEFGSRPIRRKKTNQNKMI